MLPTAPALRVTRARVLIALLALSACKGKLTLGANPAAAVAPAAAPPPAAFVITYNGNGNTSGNVPIDKTKYLSGQTVTVLGNIFDLAQPGRVFIGWNTAADGTGTSYSQASTFVIAASNVTLYAQWTAAQTYHITYDGNGNSGGSPPVDTTNYLPSQTAIVLGNTGNLSLKGFSFTGWNTQPDAGGIDHPPGSAMTMAAADLTLYAVWTALPTYSVTYDGNGSISGSVPVDTTQYESGQTITVLGNTGNLAKPGFGFMGWNTQADGSGTSLAPGSTFSIIAADVTLYAVWSVNPTYMVVYNGNGNTSGTAPVDPTQYKPRELVIVQGSGNLQKTGGAFLNWNDQPNGSGASHSPGSTFFMPPNGVILYAQWSCIPTCSTCGAPDSCGGNTCPACCTPSCPVCATDDGCGGQCPAPFGCANGCCAAGVCVSDETESGCGTGGVACQTCGDGSCCTAGTCAPTDLQNDNDNCGQCRATCPPADCPACNQCTTGVCCPVGDTYCAVLQTCQASGSICL